MFKIILILISILFFFTSKATTYYVKVSGGTGSGLDDANAWSFAKLNSTSLSAGDIVLFKRGETFVGQHSAKSGSAGNPVTYDAYGTGANPIISGFTPLTSWTLYSGNIYYATLSFAALKSVTLDGVIQKMGRYPNTGYLNYESHTANTSITDNQLTGSPNWTGAEVVIRKYRWILDRQTVTTHSGSTLTYSATSPYGNNNAYSPVNGNGYFIQGNIATLDQEGEWYYDNSASRLYMHFGSGTPSGRTVKAGTVEQVVPLNSSTYITFNNIDFDGGNFAVFCNAPSNIIFNNCNFRQQGGCAIYANGVTNLTVNGGSITDVLNCGIWVEQNGVSVTADGVVLNRTGIIPGLGRSGDGAQEGIEIAGSNTTIKNCSVINTGYNAIAFSSSGALIENNYVDSFCMVKDDGGGIYTYSSTGATIRNNTVLNAIGAQAGTEAYSSYEAFGKAAAIYLDNGTAGHGATISGNNLAHGGWAGILVNDNSSNQITGNNIYDFGEQLYLLQTTAAKIRSMTITGNKFISRTSTQNTLYIYLGASDNISLFGTFNNNYYARPISDNTTIGINRNYGGLGLTNITLATWKSTYAHDANSSGSPKTITDVNDLIFEYNATASSKIVALPYNYMDVTGATYNGTITLAPYTSAVLIKNGAAIGGCNCN